MGDILTGLGFDPSVARIVQLILATVIVLVALVATMKLSRYLLGVRRAHQSAHRLELMDSLPIDNRRRLVLVRRDGVEHLILVGGVTDVVVEASIGDHRAAEHRVTDHRPAEHRQEDHRPADHRIDQRPAELVPERSQAAEARVVRPRPSEPIPPERARAELFPEFPPDAPVPRKEARAMPQPAARVAPSPAPHPAPAPAPAAPRAPQAAETPIPAKRAEPPIRPEPADEPARSEDAPQPARAEPVRVAPVAVRADLTTVRAEPHPEHARTSAADRGAGRTRSARGAEAGAARGEPGSRPCGRSPDRPCPVGSRRGADGTASSGATQRGPGGPRPPRREPRSPQRRPHRHLRLRRLPSPRLRSRLRPHSPGHARCPASSRGRRSIRLAPSAPREKSPAVEPVAPVEPPSREPRIAAAYQEHADESRSGGAAGTGNVAPAQRRQPPAR